MHCAWLLQLEEIFQQPKPFVAMQKCEDPACIVNYNNSYTVAIALLLNAANPYIVIDPPHTGLGSQSGHILDACSRILTESVLSTS